MAYLKFKELTQYFNFYKELDINDLPTYVTDYVDKGETIEAVYSTLRDKCLFTDHKIVLFLIKALILTFNCFVVSSKTSSSL